jgi:hypothetical protein
MDELLMVCVPFATRMLEQHGEFHHFGASTDTAGQVHLNQ